MVLRNVNLVRVKDMTLEQRREMNINVDMGLVAIETHNQEYTQKAVVLKRGLVNYILNGE